VRAVHLGGNEHGLLLCLHHVIADGWSLGVLLRELAVLYPAARESERPTLPELPVQYPDFAVWQRGWLAGEALEREVGWWRERLAGAPPVLDLPADRPRPPRQSFRGATWRVRLGRRLTAALAALAHREGATPFMVLLAGLSTLLGRSAGVDDVVVGSPIAGRNRREVEDLIGFFVNTLPLRTGLGGDPGFRELLARVRSETLAAWAHQEVPFARLVEELAPARSLAHAPLFQVLFVLQNAPLGTIGLPGLLVEPLPLPAETVQLDLAVGLEEVGESLSGVFDSSRDLFDAATIGRLAGHFEVLLAGAVAAPDTVLSALPLLTAGERHQLLAEWNDTAGSFPGVCLHQLFERQAAATPDLPAIDFEGRTLTYAELNARANRIARSLRRLGVGPEVLVGVCAERSAEAIVGLLAVMKSGGAYLPLDPAYPEERLAFALEDSGARIVLTQGWFTERFPRFAGSGGFALPLDPGGDPYAAESGEDLPPVAGPDNLVYAIYTSGSTGRPKGVLVPHRGLVCLCLDLVRLWRLGPGSRHLTFNSLAFDASASNVYPVLLSGATFVVHRDPAELSGAELERFTQEHGVTHLDVPPAYWAAWLPDLAGRHGEELLPSVVQLNLGGDSASLERVRLWAELTGGRVTIFGPYGPTETTVGSTSHRSVDGREVPRGAVKLPLGRPFANVEVHVLDRHLWPVPVGVEGEIWIGGVGLTRGYLGRPDATAEVFLPNPFATVPGERLYRTGDLARWLVDGTLEFLGRVDHQVKVRGFRVELGEVETALRRHPAVREAVVLAREKGPGDRRLAAYVVAGEEVAAADLKTFVAGSLPTYMVPSSVTLLDALPLGPTGKVDRRALPEPDWVGESEDRSYEPPRTPAEQTLAGIFADLLGTGRVGRDDDFFALGGHSLLATQAVSRVRAAFGMDLPVKALFETPTVAALAVRLGTSRASEVPPVEPQPRGEAPFVFPMSFAQQRLWFLDQLAPGSPLYNLPGPFLLDGPLSVPALIAAVRAVVERHEALRTTFALAGGEPVQVIAGPDVARDFAVPVVDLESLPRAAAGAELARLAAEEAARPFDLAAGPVLRVRLVRVAEEEHAALVTFHHIASDGWSIGVFLRELSALSQAASLPPLPVQYPDVAVWQRRWLARPVLEAELAFWRRLLEGAPTVLNLPTDRPRPALTSPRGAAFSFRLPADLSRAVRETAARERATPSMVLQAAYEALLARLSGQEDLLLGIGVANRNRLETEGLIGFFVNTLVARGRLGGNPSFRALLEQVRQTSLEIFAHQDMPFDKLVDELALPRDLSRMPLVQVAFVFQNMPAPPANLGGVVLRPLPVPIATAKFDLLLALLDTEPEIEGVAEYSTDLFDEATIARWMDALRELLAAFAADPGRRLRSVPLFTDEIAAALAVAPGRIAALHPLTPTQRDLYLDHLIDPASTVYSLGLSVELPPGTDPFLWEEAVRRAAAGEEALRVRIAALRGEPFQALLSPADPWRFEHVRGESLAELMARRVKVPYDLARGPLARHFLLHGEDGSLTAVLAVHHVVCDAYSGRLFFERAAALYRGLAETEPAPGFFDWVGESLARFDTPEVEAFWRERLPRAAAIEPASGVERASRVRALRHTLAGEDLARLRAFCAERRASPAAVLRGLYAALLARLFDPAGDLLVYDVVGGRPREHAATVGCFYQVIPIVLPRDLFGGRVDDLLAAVRGFRRSLGERQNLSVLLQRRIARTGGLRFFYNYYNFAAVDLGGAPSVLKVHDSFPPDEVHLIVSDNGGELDLAVWFDERLFPGLHLLDRLLGFLRQTLAGSERLGDLDPLLEAERRQVLVEWNDTAVPRDEGADLAQLLEDQAARSPQAIALTFEGTDLTYRELHRRADALARRLRREGVGPESVVGVRLERSIEMVVALLGIVKAGGAYLPLEPSYPADRLAFMVEDSGVAAVLAAGRWAGELPGGAGVRVTALDRLPLDDDGEEGPPERALSPESPAYVIYTSGSTGRPKGAVNTHRA
ncbi:MAG TPA: amino acid adenylation domain-containing protein, partial [Thermoanaerobaculia bacterium]|nr:amino acid adenylation domain-containing protein [Thermoanaerobaculia bacterium]